MRRHLLSCALAAVMAASVSVGVPRAAEGVWASGGIDEMWREVQGPHDSSVERPREELLRGLHPDRVVRYGTLLALQMRDGRYIQFVDTLPPDGSPAGGEYFWLDAYDPVEGYTVVIERGGTTSRLRIPEDMTTADRSSTERERLGTPDPTWLRHQGTHPEGWDSEQERLLREAMPDRIFRYGTMLGLALEDGRHALLTDILPPSAFGGGFGTQMTYAARDFLVRTGHYVVGVGNGGTSWNLLVSRRTGETTTFDGDLLLEPSTEHAFVGFREGGGMGGHVLDVWEFQGAAWRRVFHCRELAPDFSPSEARWLSPTRVAVSNFIDKGQFATGAILERVEGTWRSAACRESSG